jgi:hypothetical protein
MIFISLNAGLAKSVEADTIEENQEYQNNKRAWIEIVLPFFSKASRLIQQCFFFARGFYYRVYSGNRSKSIQIPCYYSVFYALSCFLCNCWAKYVANGRHLRLIFRTD